MNMDKRKVDELVQMMWQRRYKSELLDSMKSQLESIYAFDFYSAAIVADLEIVRALDRDIRDLRLSLVRPGTAWVPEWCVMGGSTALLEEIVVCGALKGDGKAEAYVLKRSRGGYSVSKKVRDPFKEDLMPLAYGISRNLDRDEVIVEISTLAFSDDPACQAVAAYLITRRARAAEFSGIYGSAGRADEVAGYLARGARERGRARALCVGALEAMSRVGSGAVVVRQVLTEDPSLVRESEALAAVLTSEEDGHRLLETYHAL